MDHVSLQDIIFVVMSTVFLLIRNASTKAAKEEVTTTVNNKGNETQIKVEDVHACLEKRVGELSSKVESSISTTVAERAAHSAALEEIRASNNVLAFNLKRVVAQVGLEWKDDITMVHEPLKKE